MKEKVKELTVKCEKVGVLHCFVFTNEYNPKIIVCQDCHTKVKHYNRLFWSAKSKEGKPIERFLCNDCLNSYRTKDLELPTTTKIGEYKGKSIGRIKKEYKPYFMKCEDCGESFDLHKHSLFSYGGRVYCAGCTNKVRGLDINYKEKLNGK